MSTIDIRADHRQSQALSPRLQHSVRLLHMSSTDFAATLRETLGKNPFLESEDSDADMAENATAGDDANSDERDRIGQSAGDVRLAREALLDGGTAASDDAGGPEMTMRDAREDGDGSDTSDGDGGHDRSAHSEAPMDDSSDRELWHSDAGSGPRSGESGELSALDRVAVELALNTHLHGQIRLLPLSLRDLALAQTIVESLDDDGYLRTPLEELLDVPGLTPEPGLDEMQIALRRVQSLDPAGVGARSVAECLLLQLPAIVCPALRGIANRIICDHLPALAARDVAGLARRLEEPPARVEEVCNRIRRLDARPGWRFGTTRVAYVVPDVLLKKVRGQWTVQLNPAVVPKVRLNQVYAQLFQQHRSAKHAELGADLQEARWTLRNVEQRFSTIRDVAQAIVDRQRAFLDHGSMAMKPMGLRAIADALGIHESTVSRATNNKYMATPTGVYELKYFFSRSMVSANGSACSGTAIRGLVKDMLEAEDVDAPLSDAEIARQLAQQGLVVARRTVTKYRQLLKIEAVERRRRHA
ncbi:RNA polymerase factor sigma-54 [Rubrivivax sp. RP6-9]|uniref:RNA polymerase factor sigma-54 n=1 Tax=Rubrivivax sp. RP6-9 TaxID=3415750 RepID=UPI003CC5C108